MISLAFERDDIITASDLLEKVCDGDADSVWLYDCEIPAFQSWTILDTGTGWDVWTGMPFWVNITNPRGCLWLLTGDLDTSINYDLCPGLNMVSVPVYSSSIARASDLLADIPFCTAVFRWKKSVSCLQPLGFDAFYTYSHPSENYSVLLGYGYWINVTDSVNWTPPNP
jgi:hypothetical protein